MAVVMAGGSFPVHAQLPTAQAGAGEVAALANIKDAIIGATKYDSGTVEITSTPIQIVVTLINRKLMEATNMARENEAATVASIVADAASSRAELKNIVVLHVRYERRDDAASGRDVVDVIEFRKGPDGAFTHHVT